MALALSLARRGLGQVAPWPSVGCVIVKEGRIVGRGTSDRATMRHAERVALDQAGSAAQGATVYVTLEPCSHTGNTPPCADALIAAGVARVVTAIGDPNPQVAGQGLERLRAAGIAVEVGQGAQQAAEDNSGFLMVQNHGRPFLTLKLAQSFDGRIATGTGESQWITGPEARRAVHGLRARHDAVLVGGGTARKDDPSLTVRDLGVRHQPTRVVVSRRLDLPLMGQLARTAGDVPLLLCHGRDADKALMQTWRDLGAVLLPCGVRGTQLDPVDVLQKLGAHGLTRVFCEGGGALAASLIEADLVDELVGFTAGLAIGAEGLPGIGAMGLSQLAAAPRYELRDVRPVGADVMHVWRRPVPK
ncbi:MAG: bifunctional diaminohydroxyphosphoribosylaminopyrimidine deaminase/5-amino-6-(5-phosphoribosylamino)uracil reductase RibD [Sulfitobacter sp.]